MTPTHVHLALDPFYLGGLTVLSDHHRTLTIPDYIREDPDPQAISLWLTRVLPDAYHLSSTTTLQLHRGILAGDGHRLTGDDPWFIYAADEDDHPDDPDVDVRVLLRHTIDLIDKETP